MSIYRRGGMTIGTRSNVVFKAAGVPLEQVIMEAPVDFTAPLSSDQAVFQDIAYWGTNNLLPQEMLKDIESTPVLWSGIDAKARITVGNGPMLCRVASIDENGNETLEFVNDAGVQNWLDMNNSFGNSMATAWDLMGLGNAWGQMLLSRDRSQIVAYRRHDAAECRFSKRDEKTLRSEKVYISGDWNYYSSPSGDPKHFASVPLLDKDYPLYDLQNRKDSYSYMVSMQYPLRGRQYYAPSPWYAARKWVKIVQAIPEMKEAMFKNQITIKYVVDIHELFWEKKDPRYKTMTAADKKNMQDDFYEAVDDLLTGGENAYKSLFSVTIWDPHTQKSMPGITITAVDDKIKDGKLLPDGAAGNSEILFALIINPALIGVDIPGGGAVRTAGSGSNIREAYLVQVMLQEQERRILNIPFNIIKNYNGWDKSYVLRYPNKILTTLNTGSNTQAVA